MFTGWDIGIPVCETPSWMSDFRLHRTTSGIDRVSPRLLDFGGFEIQGGGRIHTLNTALLSAGFWGISIWENPPLIRLDETLGNSFIEFLALENMSSRWRFLPRYQRSRDTLGIVSPPPPRPPGCWSFLPRYQWSRDTLEVWLANYASDIVVQAIWVMAAEEWTYGQLRINCNCDYYSSVIFKPLFHIHRIAYWLHFMPAAQATKRLYTLKTDQSHGSIEQRVIKRVIFIYFIYSICCWAYKQIKQWKYSI